MLVFSPVTLNRNGYLTVNTELFYKNYKNNNNKPVSFKEFKLILKAISESIWELIIQDRRKFVPTTLGTLGSFSVRQRRDKERTFYIDWQESRRQGKVVKSYNFNSSGTGFFFSWNKNYLNADSLIKFYTFKPYRGSKESFTGSRGIKGYIDYCHNTLGMEDYTTEN